MDGIILINKEKDWTSQDVCAKAKHILKTKKVGHTGTLDPFATGLLVLTIGEGTKISQLIESLNKSYIAVLKLGEKTSTGDLNGEIIKEEKVPRLDEQKIKTLFKNMLGKQKQIPPMTSAIKVKGVPLYRLAHQGIEIERKAREIEIFDLRLMNFDERTIIFTADVSKGTYLRTLGETIAERLGTVGHLSELERTRVGRYLNKNSTKIGEINAEKVIPLNEALFFLPFLKVDFETEKKVKNGMSINLPSEEKIVVLQNYQNQVLAIYQKNEKGMYNSLRGFNHGND
ncbi:MAG: tRNA pseudouridine(55) synthase TruB [Bacilli bacterium]